MSSGNTTQNLSENESVLQIMQGRVMLWTKPALLPVAFQFSSPSTCTQEQRGFPAPLQGQCLWEGSSRGKNTETLPLELLVGEDAAVEMCPQPVALRD